MENTETQNQINLPVIRRLDRLELLLNYIEAQKNLPVQTEETDHECDPCKDLSTALEEVPLKGSLMERVTSLERHVLKLTEGLEEDRSASFKKLTINSCRCTLEEKMKENKQAIQIEDQNGVSAHDKDLEKKEKQMNKFDSEKRERKSKKKD